jgi:heme/copper-type cytochrome/quinol oxidase subunit 1
MCGFPDMLFPRMNNMSLWLFLCGCLVFVTGFACEEGAGVGWTLYPTLICCDFHLGVSVDFVIFSVHLLGISSLLNSINVVGTIFICRRKYYSSLFLCLFIWGVLLTSFLLILCLPILAGGVTLILFDRNFNTAF